MYLENSNKAIITPYKKCRNSIIAIHVQNVFVKKFMYRKSFLLHVQVYIVNKLFENKMKDPRE